MQTNKLVLPPNFLEADSVYTFELSAFDSANPSVANTASVNVLLGSSPPTNTNAGRTA